MSSHICKTHSESRIIIIHKDSQQELGSLLNHRPLVMEGNKCCSAEVLQVMLADEYFIIEYRLTGE